MQVIQIYMQNMLRNFNYIVYSEISKEAIFFDPLNLDMTLEVSESLGLKPKYLINTHQHHDHIQDNEKFLKLPGTKHIKLKDKEVISMSKGDYIQAMDTPGHVMDHQCFLVYSDSKAVGLISGDALFNAGVGNCKNGGDVKTHFDTIHNKIADLDDEIKVYPSHDYLLTNLEFAKTINPSDSLLDEWISRRSKQDLDKEFIITTMADEKRINPFLKVKSEKEFIELRQLRDKW